MAELSIIIPTFNRVERLRACLHALARQTQAARTFEVIVADDGSTDSTREMLANLVMPYELRVISELRAGQTNARNRGADSANGRYLLFLDDDIRAAPGLVKTHLDAQRAGERLVGIGALTMDAMNARNWFMHEFITQWNEHYLRMSSRPLSWRDCYSGNFSLPRKFFLECGGFATDLPTWFDLELGYRLYQCGARFVFLEDARGEHDDYKNTGRLLNASYAEGNIAPEIVRRHPDTAREIFGKFWNGTPRSIALRRALLRSNLAPQTPRLGMLFPSVQWKREAFRALQDYAYWRGLRDAVTCDDWARITSRTPILMYHAFKESSQRASRFVMPIQRFATQLEWLQSQGYQFLALYDLVCSLKQNRLPPARSVVLTLDDGYADNFSLALPLLKKYRVPATLFVVSERVGTQNDWDKESELRGRALMDREQLQTMVYQGIEIGAHSRTHAHLVNLSEREICRELVGSREQLEGQLDVPVRFFAYPFGESNECLQALANHAGFLGSCTVKRGLNNIATPLHALHRVEIHGTDSIREFARRVRRGE